MGRAIDQDNRLDDHERRLKLIEDALEELVQTRVHHVDLHNGDKEYIDKLKEEEFTPPVGKRKKTTKRKTVTVEKSNAEA
jgi:hypothetical protein